MGTERAHQGSAGAAFSAGFTEVHHNSSLTVVERRWFHR